MLSATRQRLILAYNQLALPLAQQQGFINPHLQKQLQRTCKAMDAPIDPLIQADPHLKDLFTLMTSVPGIGAAMATQVLIATNELQTITDPKKMAC